MKFHLYMNWRRSILKQWKSEIVKCFIYILLDILYFIAIRYFISIAYDLRIYYKNPSWINESFNTTTNTTISDSEIAYGCVVVETEDIDVEYAIAIETINNLFIFDDNM